MSTTINARSEIENAKESIQAAIVSLIHAESQLDGCRAQDYVKEVIGWLQQSQAELALAKRLVVDYGKLRTSIDEIGSPHLD